jgi:uncharacterized protein
MESSLQAIYIPQIAKALDRTEVLEVDEYLSNLETLTPVQGMVRVAHQGNYLEVTGDTETIVTLACDRCLQQYNYRLQVHTSEIIWLKPSDRDEFQPLEQEVEYDELVETLPPEGNFEPATWLYEQLCLALPQQQLCSEDCAGLPMISDADSPSLDRRWAMLEQLRDQLPKSSVSDE